MLCADPNAGAIYRHLFAGGSWFEAEQMHWRLQQQHALDQLKAALEAKATKSNQDKAQTALGLLEECAKQLVPSEDAMAVFKRADQVVKVWTPAAAKAAAKPKNSNVFAALNEDSEEE